MKNPSKTSQKQKARGAGKMQRPRKALITGKAEAPKPPVIGTEKPERIAKVLARAGLCSRRDAEKWIEAGRVNVNGERIQSPALNVSISDYILVDGVPLPKRDRTRLWLFNKPKGFVTTNRDPEGRPTIFEKLPEDLPRVITIGRLDMNTEGLLLLTNDGGLARLLELPETGWLRRYKVRAHPRDQRERITQQDLDKLQDGIVVDGVIYGSVEAVLDQAQGSNLWLSMGLREGKNREVKNILSHLGLDVNRLIRLSYGPFQLGDLKSGEVREVRGRVLRDQLGTRLMEKANIDPGEAEIASRSERQKSGVKAAASKAQASKTTPSRGKKRHWSEDGGVSAKTAARIKETKGAKRPGKTSSKVRPARPAKGRA